MRKISQINRVATVSIVLISLILTQLPVGGQTRHGTRRAPTVPVRPTKSEQMPRQPTTSDLASRPRMELVKSPKSIAMAKAFNSGKLPEPLRMPTGSVDEQATALAKAVSVGDDSSTAALYAAVLAAGYGVRESDGSVMQTMEHGQGLLSEAGEIAATAKLYGEGYGVGLGHLGQSFTKIPSFKDVQIAAELLEGVRAAAKSEHPAVRFWGRFIVELGKNSAAHYDLMGQINPAETRLDAVQVYLILSRLAGDLALMERPSQAGQGPASREPGDEKYPVSYAHHAHSHEAVVGITRNHLRFVHSRLGMPLQQPCGTTEKEGVVLDWEALAATNLHGKLLERMGHTGKEIPIANIVLGILKFILTYAMLETEITIGKKPLVRTKTTTSGELDVLIARVWIDNKAQGLNCVRPFLNAIGLDFNLPNSGPLSDVNVVWEGVMGFDEASRGSITEAQNFIQNLGKEPTPGEKLVYFDFMSNTKHSRTEQYTDVAGISIVYAVGAPQDRDLSREKLTEVNKVAGVMIRVQVKSTQNKDWTSKFGTAGDFLGPVVALLTGDIAGGAVGLATETLYRMSWRGSDPSYFVVKDWEPCKDGQWRGTITATVDLKQTEHERLPTGFQRDYEHTYHLDGNINLGSEAFATITAGETTSDDQRAGPGRRVTTQQDAEARYSGVVDATVSVFSDGTFMLGFPHPKMVGTMTQTNDCERPTPHKWQKPCVRVTTKNPWEPFMFPPSLKGTIDPAKPNEINVEKPWKDGEVNYWYKVKLVRCQ